MNIRKITVELGDLTVTLAPLNLRMEARIRRMDPKEFDLIEYHAPLCHLQLVTFKFGKVNVRAFCYESDFPSIVRLLGSETPENALDKCEGFLLEDHVVASTLGNEKTIKVLKTSIAQRIEPNITALLQSERE
jgi:hypothetical protein